MKNRLPERLLLGPGPSNVPVRVREALARPLVGHLDPEFLALMTEIQDLLRYVFQTENRLTIPVSGTGSAGMECAVSNFVEEGDSVLVGVNGVFGERIADCARRAGARVTAISSPFGQPLDQRKMTAAAAACKPALVAVVHAETSTGVLQPLEPIRGLCRQHGSLLLVDAVTSLGGHPLHVDEWGIDICYSGTQKCLNCPPGLAPLTVSDRALEKLKSRSTPVRSWYLDLSLLQNYWGDQRAYHHTAPISMNYALHEALQLVQEEGLEARWLRHKLVHEGFVAGIEALGMQMHVDEGFRLWPLNTIRIPEGIDDATVRARLLNQYGLEIGGGLGGLKGKVWRVGLMGENSSPKNVLFFLHALENCLRQEGFACSAGSGVEAAGASLTQPAP